ncbi:uncharacterized protein LOC123293605 isoform X2 [Chrysoperla carnea]|uniref:uncharacterized protein LOC123293605 isoform X2 n=1 Tax=Chrysoperla carnea TaxID=189513 RepID=UPI001D080F60|nr:uncharacterized protein LOC123293605 isoform X2 [Chrysoperla carnea]
MDYERGEEKQDHTNINTTSANEDDSDDYEDFPCPNDYQRTTRQPEYGRGTGNRIDEMSRPTKRRLLALYEQYGRSLSPNRLRNVKQMLEEMFCMTPEQTEKYFQELREEAENRKRLRKLRRKEHLRYKKQKSRERKAKVRLKVICILRDCMIKAYNTPMQILMSERLRQVSNVCLAQLCDILCRKIPDRDSQDRVSRLLIAFADWMAYWIEAIAYDLETYKLDDDNVSAVDVVESPGKVKNNFDSDPAYNKFDTDRIDITSLTD